MAKIIINPLKGLGTLHVPTNIGHSKVSLKKWKTEMNMKVKAVTIKKNGLVIFIKLIINKILSLLILNDNEENNLLTF
ncbi:MAG: hypothetical protein KY054_01085 [Candidatus Nealsonbacteria bacterium]|nr:hypothetical protein [Candidatus Nealsonbacteria bacterium]